MKIVIDNNVLFSLMNPHSMNSFIFELMDVEFFAPTYILTEFKKYKKECIVKSGLSKKEFDMRQKEIVGALKLIKLLEYKKFLKQSSKVLRDFKDTSYLALAVSINAIIWSNDKHFKQQSMVSVFTTKELVEFLH